MAVVDVFAEDDDVRSWGDKHRDMVWISICGWFAFASVIEKSVVLADFSEFVDVNMYAYGFDFASSNMVSFHFVRNMPRLNITNIRSIMWWCF